MRRICAAVLALAGALLLTAPVLADQPGGNTGTLTLDNSPSFGGTAVFTATYTPMRQIAEESVSCRINGTDVYLQAQTAPNTTQPWVSTFKLTSPEWVAAGGGPATCTAQLYFYTWQGHTEVSVTVLATVTFSTS